MKFKLNETKLKGRLADAVALADSIGLDVEPAGMRHAYVNACAEIPPPRYVVRTRRPAYDLYHCRTIEELMTWLLERQEAYRILSGEAKPPGGE